ncbi:hypothetical protein ACL02S_16590 [Nocardia sp. 004]|uniref:hypothetical protein n=1 Tax=Nocardia sp. 004 TaxID=3385978 RepID=UPI0039A10737
MRWPPNGSPPHHQPNGRGRGKIALLTGAVVLLVAAVTIGALAPAEPEAGDSAHGSPPSMVSALSTGAPQATTTNAGPTTPLTTNRVNDQTPRIPGYRVVVAPDNAAAYDVPADWTIAPPRAIGGFGKPPDVVAGKGYASEGKGYCPGSTRTIAFLTGSDITDPAIAATELGTKTALLAYRSAPGAPGTPEPLTSLDGSQRGVFVATTGTVTEAKPGCATAYSVYTAAFPNEQGNFIMVIAADTGVPHALDAATAKRICTSIRPLHN